MKEVLLLANHAVCMMKESKYREVVTVLRQSLRMLQRERDDSIASEKLLSPSDSSSSTPFTVRAVTLMEEEEAGSKSMCQADFPIFDGAFAFCSANTNRINEDSNLIARSDVTIAVVMYNTALCYHKKAIESGSTELLRKALALYQMSYQSVQHFAANDDNVRADANFASLVLALYHNMGYIHLAFFDKPKVFWCMQRLCLVLTISSTQSNSQQSQYFFSQALMSITSQENDIMKYAPSA
jgi:hypothetical protein